MSAKIMGNHNAHDETDTLVWEILISLRDQLVSRAYPLFYVEKTHPQLRVYAMAGRREQCWSKPTTLFTHEQSE